MSLRALFVGYLEAKHRSLQGLGSVDGFREALELFAEGRKLHEEAAGAVERGNKDAELTKAYDVLSRAEVEALDIQNMTLVRDIRTERDKVGKERAALRKSFSKKTIKSMSLPETLQIRLLDDLLDAFGRLKDRFTHDRNIATLKDARSLFKFEAFTNLLDSRVSEKGHPLTSQEKSSIWSMIPDPSDEDLARFRSEASMRKIQKMVDTIRTHILTLAETNFELAAHYKRRTEAIASR